MNTIIIISLIMIIILLYFILKKIYQRSIIIGFIFHMIIIISLISFIPNKPLIFILKILSKINGNYGGWEYEIESGISGLSDKDTPYDLYYMD